MVPNAYNPSHDTSDSWQELVSLAADPIVRIPPTIRPKRKSLRDELLEASTDALPSLMIPSAGQGNRKAFVDPLESDPQQLVE